MKEGCKTKHPTLQTSQVKPGLRNSTLSQKALRRFQQNNGGGSQMVGCGEERFGTKGVEAVRANASFKKLAKKRRERNIVV